MLHARTGILPEALLNFVVRLGWSHGDDEVMSIAQMTEWFDFAGVGTTSGVWNPDKLLWLNQHYLKTLPLEQVAERLLPLVSERYGISSAKDSRLLLLVRVLRERTKTLSEMADKAAMFFSPGVVWDEKAAAKHLTAEAKPVLEAVRAGLAGVSPWASEGLEGAVKAVSAERQVGLGKVAQAVRVAVTGGTASPGIGETLELMGKDEALSRLDAALATIR
jgi:glutamyl-tRNA synthetase